MAQTRHWFCWYQLTGQLQFKKWLFIIFLWCHLVFHIKQRRKFWPKFFRVHTKSIGWEPQKIRKWTFVFEKRKKIKFRSAMALGHLCILEFKFEKLKRSVLGFCLGNGNIRSIDFSSPEYPYLRKNIFCVFASPIHSDQHFKRTSLL